MPHRLNQKTTTLMRNRRPQSICLLAAIALALFALPCKSLLSDDYGLFMFGQEDAAGQSLLKMETLLGEEQKDFLEAGAQLKIDGKEYGGVVKLGGAYDTLRLEKSILSREALRTWRGKTVRVFVWIKGDGIAAKNQLWFGAPTVRVDLYDGPGNLASSSTSVFKTRGTFPWHCYFVDVDIPESLDVNERPSSRARNINPDLEIGGAAETRIRQIGLGAYVTFSCYGGGTARFAGLSWKGRTDADCKVSPDLESGTCAPNPAYDELPMMIYFGLSSNPKSWHFLDGNKAFPSLKKRESIQNYIREHTGDWLHLQYGIARLPWIWETARELKLLSGIGFEEGWLDIVLQEIGAAQDPKTGLWCTDGAPSILGTAAILEAVAPYHAKSPIRYPEVIIRTLLDNRISRQRRAWSQFALQPRNLGTAKERNAVDLATTFAAAKCLALAAAALPKENALVTVADNAILEAWKCTLDTLVPANLENGPWKDNSDDLAASATGAFLLEFAQLTDCLAFRFSDNMPAPILKVGKVLSSGDLSATWDGADTRIDSVRIFRLPADRDPKEVTAADLYGIVSRESRACSDPWVIVPRLAAAAAKKWKVTPRTVDAFQLEEQLAAVPTQFKTLKEKTGFSLSDPKAAKPAAEGEEAEAVEYRFYAASVNALGLMSPLVPIELPAAPSAQ